MATKVRGLLLVGTDTNVGKTSLAEGLLRLAARKRFRLVPFKPVETGCQPTAQDAARLTNAAALPLLSTRDVCPVQLGPPVAPATAARLAGKAINPDTLVAAATAMCRHGDALLIESAGGLLTPYGPGITSASLSVLFDVDVLLVSANRLGTINHTALALAELARRGLPTAGWVLVQVSPASTPDQPHNAAEITALTGQPPLGTLRFCPDPTPDRLADAVAADLALGTLLGGALT